MRAIGYLRVSTEEQAASGLGLEAQRARVLEEIARRGWELTALEVDDGYTAANLNRPGIARALEELAAHRADCLVVSKLDRLSRSLLDFAGLMAQARRQGWQLVALDLGLDTSSPSGELMAAVLASFAQYERRLIGQRTSDALAAKKRQGHRLGRPVVLPAETRRRIVRLRARGWSLPKIADALNAEGIATARGRGTWYPSTVAGVLKSVHLDTAAKAAKREAAA
jgi:DNA invertase Pin-like site-specific DNA recombinase